MLQDDDQTSSVSDSLFTFGIIGDTQYVDADDGATHDGKTVRRYRQSLQTLIEACISFKKSKAMFCILMGDVVDCKCKSIGNSDKCLKEVLDTVESSGSQWHYCIGNHDLLCFSRGDLYQKLIPEDIRSRGKPSELYYDFSPYKGYRFIILDGYEVSSINASSEENRVIAENILKLKNPNLAISGAGWFEGLAPMDLRYVPFNGGLSDRQLLWFEDILTSSSKLDERCFVFCHMPCYPSCCRTNGLMWSSEDVLRIMHKHPGTVAAFVAGHDHNGGYAVDSQGIHHIIPPSPLECDVGEVAYGHITVHEPRLSTLSPFFELHWTGKIPESVPKKDWPTRMIFPTKPSIFDSV